MNLRPGTKLRSAVCATEVIVVKAPPEPVDLQCGGVPMLASGTSVTGGDGRLSPEHASGTQIGKRYAGEAGGLEVLCIKPGEGSLSIGAEPLLLKEAKPLPSSD